MLIRQAYTMCSYISTITFGVMTSRGFVCKDKWSQRSLGTLLKREEKIKRDENL